MEQHPDSGVQLTDAERLAFAALAPAARPAQPVAVRVGALARAFTLGLLDWRDCALYGGGRTWEDDPACNAAYDRAVNLGENAATIARVLRHPLTHHGQPVGGG